MLGLDDPFVLAAYLGIIALAVLSILYGLIRRNAARDEITEEDRQWALEEKKVDDEI
ncbi:symporter small accessory protein [Thermochromatium tepidum]|uniref:symporter small accessory protein n=1 Tax=Thermochromatium tepidum TaxID=1050 RepID=UPI0014786277|nr:symporter small accessory protein [Thermochromatium tepidum]